MRNLHSRRAIWRHRIICDRTDRAQRERPGVCSIIITAMLHDDSSIWTGRRRVDRKRFWRGIVGLGPSNGCSVRSDGSTTIADEVRALIVEFARNDSNWGYTSSE